MLAKVLAFEQAQERLGCGSNALGNGFARTQLAGADQGAQLLERIGPHFHVFAHDEALDLHAVNQHERRVGHGQGCAVVASDHAAQGDAAEGVHAQHHGVHDPAAHVFKVAVDAVGAGFLECLGHGFHVAVHLVVNAGVKAQLFSGVLALVRTTGNAHHTAAAGFGQGSKRTAHRAGRSAHHHGVAFLGGNDLDQAIPGRHAGHADGAQVVRQRHMGRIDLAQRTRGIGIHHAVLLPAAHAHHLVAHGVLGVAAFHHLAHRAANHHFAQGLRCGVALALVHAAAHVGVQAQVVVAHQHLAIGQRRGLCRHQLEVAGHGFALGAVVEEDLLIDGHGKSFCYGFNSCQRFICKRQRPKILEVLICTSSLQSVETDLSWLMLRPSTGRRLTYLNVPVAWLQMRPAASYTEPSVKASVAVR